VKPFFKWVGGKTQLLPQILPRVPEKIGGYFEPFVGAGALFFSLAEVPRWRTPILADTNPDLLCAYRILRDSPEDLIAELGQMRRNKAEFLRVRRTEPTDDLERAVRFIYLMKTCFNGLWRVNRSGQFNTPFGASSTPICDADHLRACSRALQGSQLRLGDFEATTHDAREGDFVYFDPPYLPLNDAKSFTSFTPGGFTLNDQIRLRDHALKLEQRGVTVLLSNSGGKMTRDLYAEHFDLTPVKARRSVSASGAARDAVREYLIA